MKWNQIPKRAAVLPNIRRKYSDFVKCCENFSRKSINSGNYQFLEKKKLKIRNLLRRY